MRNARSKFRLALITLIVTITNVHALTPREELLNLSKRYNDAKGFSMNINVAIYFSSQDAAPQQQYKGVIMKSSSCYYSHIMGQISLVNERCQIVVDEQQKVIYYDGQKIKSDIPKRSSYDFTSLIDSAVMPNNKVQFVSQGNENVLEVIPVKADFYKRMLITYVSSSHEITDVTYFFDESDDGNVGKVKISYSQIQLGPEPAESFFSEKKFIEKKSNTILPSSAYAGYQIVDITEPVSLPTDKN